MLAHRSRMFKFLLAAAAILYVALQLATCDEGLEDVQDFGFDEFDEDLDLDDFGDAGGMGDMGGMGGMPGGMGGMGGMPGGMGGMGGMAEPEEEMEEALPAVQFTRPATAGFIFAELFDEDWESRWVRSSDSRFTGEWLHSLRAKEAILGDYGLKVANEARHHAISARFPRIEPTKGQGYALSYEAKFENDLHCGGAYLKLFDSKGMDLENFNNETPYVIMFGPDRCGSTNKVHVIIKSKNPISGEWQEHHLKNPPRVPHEPVTHAYTLYVKPDNTYEVLVDNEVAISGSVFEDFEPPFTPLKEIDDPEDQKPEDWVDEETIPDPNAVKPDDWNEDAPRMIPDPDASKPEGWVEDAETEIADPDVTKPSDWDDEEDGEWVAPMIPNPVCSVGCGVWKSLMVKNPDFKGRWSAPKIANPDYKGPWAPRQIPNPNYFQNENPHVLSAGIDAVGFELWTMQSGLLFDNIVISRSPEETKKFLEETFEVRKRIEMSHRRQTTPSDVKMGAAQKFLASIYVMALERPAAAGIGATIFLFSFFWLIFRIVRAFTTKTALKAKDVKTTPKSKAKSKPKKESDTAEGEDEDEDEEEEEEEEQQPQEKKPVPRKRGTARPTAAD